MIRARRRKPRTLLEPEEVGGLTLLKQVQLSLPVSEKRRVVDWLRTRPVSDAELALSSALVVHVGPEVTAAVERARRYVTLRERLVEVNPLVCDGEPVIRGTRVPVRGLARQIELGETPQVLHEEYPFLPEEAFELAPLWARGNPRQGRPLRSATARMPTSPECARSRI